MSERFVKNGLYYVCHGLHSGSQHGCVIHTYQFMKCECPLCIPGNDLNPDKCWFHVYGRFSRSGRHRVLSFQTCEGAKAYPMLTFDELVAEISRFKSSID